MAAFPAHCSWVEPLLEPLKIPKGSWSTVSGLVQRTSCHPSLEQLWNFLGPGKLPSLPADFTEVKYRLVAWCEGLGRSQGECTALHVFPWERLHQCWSLCPVLVSLMSFVLYQKLTAMPQLPASALRGALQDLANINIEHPGIF